MDKNSVYRSIPKVDVLLEDEAIQKMVGRYGRASVLEAVRIETDRLRQFIAGGGEEEEANGRVRQLASRIARTAEKMHAPNMRKVINGTGTVLHTNLGRAPISRAHMRKAIDIVSGYSNLEYDLEWGRRGERHSHFEELLCTITGAEAALAVNNNAAAMLLILNSLTEGGEVIVSRGELIEIGGKFRIPDVVGRSGAVLVEVGTTNKTHFSDYEEGITEETKALLKVHTSNYRIVGFTESVTVGELVPLARKKEIPVIEDLGSGVLIDLSKYGLSYEPTVQESIANGADVVCFSGDKLLGGPQAGIIIGKKRYIEQMKRNPLIRALRIDKLTAATLELALREYLSEEKAAQNIPALRMIAEPLDEVERRAGSLAEMLCGSGIEASVETVSCESQIGGGALPLERIPSMAVAIRPQRLRVTELEEGMRHLSVPIIPRTVKDAILLDVRTIESEDFGLIAAGLTELLTPYSLQDRE